MRFVGADGVEYGPGDTVEAVNVDGCHQCVQRGARYVVSEVHPEQPSWVWLNTTCYVRHADECGGWTPHRFKVVRPTHVRRSGATVRTTLPVDSAARKEVPLYSGPFRCFPAALAGLARVCRLGSAKHNLPGTPIQHNRALSTDHPDALLRHLTDMSEDFGHGIGRDEQGVPQVDYMVWRVCAMAQAWHEEHDGAPVAPAATNVGGVK